MQYKNQVFQNYQIELEKLGLNIDDIDKTRNLSSISKFRFREYYYPFLDLKSNRFKDSTNLSDILIIYEFDRMLRLLILDAIERIEIYFRKQFSDIIDSKYGSSGHLKKEHFHKNFKHQIWILNLKKLAEKSGKISKSENLCEFNELPIYEVVETMTFGSLSKGFYGLNPKIRNIIATEICINLNGNILAKHLHCLSYTRNKCAHHNRIWNHTFRIYPNRLNQYQRKIAGVIEIIDPLIQNIEGCGRWKRELDELLKPIVTEERWKNAMKIPDEWINN